jgi:ElaB/YqjD/DUF883 family membrane-anchored ribosome-binding protein
MTASSTINTVTSNMADRAHQAIDRAAEKVVPGVDRMRTGAHNTIDKVADSATSGVDWAAENTRALANRGAEWTEQCSEYVREKPLVAVAGALALGYLVGRMLK